MAVNTGSPYTATDVDGAAAYAFPNAQGQIHFTADTAVVGQKYDVYMLWSMAGTPGQPSPASVKFYGAYEPWTESSKPVAANKVINLVPPQASGIVERSQLPFSFTREDAGRISHFKMGRQQDTVGGTMRIRGFELVPTPDLVEASVSPAGNLSPASFNTPYSGTKVISLLSLYTPIWTTANAVYVVAPVTVGGVQQSRLAKLNKNTYEMIQDVQIGTGTHDTTIGHRDGSVCVTDDGKVITYGEAHHTPWKGLSAPTEDISALVATTAPTGLDVNCSYRRFFRNQFDGSMWMGARGNGYLAGIFKWNGATFDRKGADFLAGNAASYLGSYGMEIAFSSVDTLYVTTEFLQGNGPFEMSGYPRQNISMIKSTDGGATFTTMRGKALNLPLVSGTDDSDIAFPNNNLNHNSSVARIAIGADGQPLLVASWQHPDEAFRSMWVAKYNTTTNKWVRTRLMAHNGLQDAGTPHVAYHDGKIFVTAATTDDNVPATLGTANQLYLFTTTDSGATWKKYAITHPAGAYSGAYIDQAALRLDNKLRLLPDFEAQPTSVIWEMPVPGGDTTAPEMVGNITVSAITTSGATLSCAAATDAVGVAGYEYSINGGTNYTVIANAARSVVVSGRPASTAHAVRMRAFDAAGNRATPLSASFTTLAEPPAQNAVVASTIAESRRVAFPGGTRVVAFGSVPGARTPNAPYLEAGKWWSEKHPLDERYWVANITVDLAERGTTAVSVEAIVAGVTVLQQPVIQGKLIPVKLGGFNAATGAVNFCTFRVTCANGERFDRTIWFKQQVGSWSLEKDADDESYFVADISNDLADSNTSASAVLALPVGVSVLVPAVIQGALILVKLGGMDTLPAGVNYCDLRIDCANSERFYRTIQFNRVDN
ncbi:hypothetical protein ACFOY5_10725 [Massilia aurea]|jgi:hypothetical protein|uniref:hypothetical protein n=1 Tax=Massilia aurea TaxID=373040 RepID=UPI002162681D|nr:hypothetical protein [Massilia aurea]MCS0709469.1 hypothetical protein [Massilia aurea]